MDTHTHSVDTISCKLLKFHQRDTTKERRREKSWCWFLVSSCQAVFTHCGLILAKRVGLLLCANAAKRTDTFWLSANRVRAVDDIINQDAALVETDPSRADRSDLTSANLSGETRRKHTFMVVKNVYLRLTSVQQPVTRQSGSLWCFRTECISFLSKSPLPTLLFCARW